MEMDKELAADLILGYGEVENTFLLAVSIFLSIYSEHDRACNAGFA